MNKTACCMSVVAATVFLAACSDSGPDAQGEGDFQEPSAALRTSTSNASVPESLIRFADRHSGFAVTPSLNLTALLNDPETTVEPGDADLANFVAGNDTLLDLQFASISSDIKLLDEAIKSLEVDLSRLGEIQPLFDSVCVAIPQDSWCNLPLDMVSGVAENAGRADLRLATYLRLYGENGYDHQVRTSFGEPGYNRTLDEVLWNASASRVNYASEGTARLNDIPADYFFSLGFDVTEYGYQFDVSYDWASGSTSVLDRQAVSFLGDDSNTVLLSSETSSADEIASVLTSTLLSANVDGGMIRSVSVAQLQGVTQTLHSSLAIDVVGSITAAKTCDESNSVDCANAENWNDVTSELLANDNGFYSVNLIDEIDPGLDNVFEPLSVGYEDCVITAFRDVLDIDALEGVLEYCEEEFR